METVILIIAGLAIGIVMGALGAGGSMLSIPALMTFFALQTLDAGTVSLMIVGGMALISGWSHWRLGHVVWGYAWQVFLVGLVPILVGSWAARLLPERIVTTGLIVVLLLAAAVMLWGDRLPGSPTRGSQPATAPQMRGRLWFTAAFTGLLTGVFGISGGFLLVPALVGFLGLPMTTAVGTSLVVVVLKTAVSLPVRLLGEHNFALGEVMPFALAAILGAFLGSRITSSVNPRTLRILFAVIVLGASVHLLRSFL